MNERPMEFPTLVISVSGRGALLFSREFNEELLWDGPVVDGPLRTGRFAAVEREGRDGRVRTVTIIRNLIRTRVNRSGQVEVETDIVVRKGRRGDLVGHSQFGPVSILPCHYRRFLEGNYLEWIRWKGREENGNARDECKWIVAADVPEIEPRNEELEEESRIGKVKAELRGEDVREEYRREEMEVREEGDVERIGIVTGKTKDETIVYVWSPGIHPLFEGELHLKGGRPPQCGTWIGFTVSQYHFDQWGQFGFRFVILQWKIIDDIYPTRRSPGGKTIDIIVNLQVSKDTISIKGDETSFIHEDLGLIADRDGRMNKYSDRMGGDVLVEVIIRRVKLRHKGDAPWTVLDVQRVEKKKESNDKAQIHKEKKQLETQTCRMGIEEKEEEKKEERNWRKEPEKTRQLEKKDTKGVYTEGTKLETGAIVEGISGKIVYVWCLQVAASGIIRYPKSTFKIGDSVFGQFIYSARDGKWICTNGVFPVNPSKELKIRDEEGRLVITLGAAFNTVKRKVFESRFGEIDDRECHLPRHLTDKEIVQVEIVKMREGWNVCKVLE